MEIVKRQYETLLQEISMDWEFYGESSTDGFK